MIFCFLGFSFLTRNFPRKFRWFTRHDPSRYDANNYNGVRYYNFFITKSLLLL